MNQPTKQQIEEAMAKISIETSHYIGGGMAECDLCGSRGLAEYMDTLAHGDTCPFNVIHTALEQYKPKTVSREWVENFVGCIRTEPYLEDAYSIVGKWLKEKVIKVEGQSPEDKS